MVSCFKEVVEKLGYTYNQNHYLRHQADLRFDAKQHFARQGRKAAPFMEAALPWFVMDVSDKDQKDFVKSLSM